MNHTITENIFPEQLKKSENIPLYKKKDPLKKEKYKRVSTCTNVFWKKNI